MNKGAKFNDDRTHRYALWRIWNPDKPLIMFIGLNPSTANETEPDPTINRVTRFAFDHKFGGLYMMNLFSMVTPFPVELQADVDPENDRWLEKVSLVCKVVCFAWGAFGEAPGRYAIRERAAEMIRRYPGAHCLGRTKFGSPKHPLYLPADTPIIPFT